MVTEEPGGCASRPCRSRREGGVLLRPTPHLGAKLGGRSAVVKTEINVSNEAAGARGGERSVAWRESGAVDSDLLYHIYNMRQSQV